MVGIDKAEGRIPVHEVESHRRQPKLGLQEEDLGEDHGFTTTSMIADLSSSLTPSAR